MRPINRVEPLGQWTERKDHTISAPHLVRTFGRYCVYCEAVLSSFVSVDHRFPQDHAPNLPNNRALDINDWENLLPSCTSCNSSKSKKIETLDNLADYYWPDTHNTFLLFQYKEDGMIVVNRERIKEHIDILENVANNTKESVINRAIVKAKKTIALVDLNTKDSGFNRGNISKKSDLRVSSRKRMWQLAVTAAASYKNNPSDALMGQILNTIEAAGFWSVWLTVFTLPNNEHMAPVINEMMAVPGTAAVEGQPIVSFEDNELSFRLHTGENLGSWRKYLVALGAMSKNDADEAARENEAISQESRRSGRIAAQARGGHAATVYNSTRNNNLVLEPGRNAVEQAAEDVLGNNTNRM